MRHDVISSFSWTESALLKFSSAHHYTDVLTEIISLRLQRSSQERAQVFKNIAPGNWAHEESKTPQELIWQQAQNIKIKIKCIYRIVLLCSCVLSNYSLLVFCKHQCPCSYQKSPKSIILARIYCKCFWKWLDTKKIRLKEREILKRVVVVDNTATGGKKLFL